MPEPAYEIVGHTPLHRMLIEQEAIWFFNHPETLIRDFEFICNRRGFTPEDRKNLIGLMEFLADSASKTTKL